MQEGFTKNVKEPNTETCISRPSAIRLASFTKNVKEPNTETSDQRQTLHLRPSFTKNVKEPNTETTYGNDDVRSLRPFHKECQRTKH